MAGPPNVGPRKYKPIIAQIFKNSAKIDNSQGNVVDDRGARGGRALPAYRVKGRAGRVTDAEIAAD